MPRYEVRISSPAERDLRRIERPVAKRLLDRAEQLGAAPRPPGVEKLAGFEDVYRVRGGAFRIVYQVRDSVLLVLVVAIASRGNVYQVLRRRLR